METNLTRSSSLAQG